MGLRSRSTRIAFAAVAAGALAVAAPAMGANVSLSGGTTALQLDKNTAQVLTLFALLGVLVMISANNLLTVYLGLELQALALYALVALRRDDTRATEAAMKYFVLGALASGFLLYGMSMLYGASGTLDLNELARNIVAGRVASRSALVLGEVARRHDTLLFCVDHHRGPDGPRGTGSPEMSRSRECHDPEMIRDDDRFDSLPDLRRNLADAELEEGGVFEEVESVGAGVEAGGPSLTFQFLDREHVQGHRIEAETEFVENGGVMQEAALLAFVLANQGIDNVQRYRASEGEFRVDLWNRFGQL